MSEEQVITGWRGVCVEMGLGQPYQRGVCAGLLSGIVLYGLGFPKISFTEDGSIKPPKFLQDHESAAREEEEGTNWHFILTPALIGLTVSLVT